jgi:valyl-tRNA synthetase
MTVRDIIQQIEIKFGKQSEKYMFQLLDDALDEIATSKQNYVVSATTDLLYKKRWYPFDDQVIDVIKVEVKDTDGRYVKVPKLTDPQHLLRDDSDAAEDSLT